MKRYGSRKIVMLAALAKFQGILTKAPLNARTLSAHVYGERKASHRSKLTPRAMPLIPVDVKIEFKLKQGKKWIAITRRQALKRKTRAGLRFSIPAENVPEIIARHEARQGGRYDWANVTTEVARIAKVAD